MRFPMDRPVKVVMLGAGGTGGYVAPYLFRLLHMLDRPARFITHIQIQATTKIVKIGSHKITCL